MKSDKKVEAIGLLLNAGYLALMLVWFLRRPENLSDPGACILLLPPFLSFWCIRRRPFKIAALIAGVPATALNIILLFVAFIGTGFSSKREVELLLMSLFTTGNLVLMLVSWLGAIAARKADVDPEFKSLA